MSFINSLSSGEKGIRGARGDPGIDGATGTAGTAGTAGADGADGADGAAGVRGYRGYTGDTGAAGTNAGPDPTFSSVDVGTIDCETFKNNGYKILDVIFMQLNYDWHVVPDIGNRFTGLVTVTSELDNLSCGTFVISNTNSSQGGIITELYVKPDDADANIKVRLQYFSNVLKITKNNDGYYQKYRVTCFGFH